MNIKTRNSIEQRIVKKAAECLIASGFSVAVFDGEEIAQAATTDMKKIKDALFATEEDYLQAYDSEGKQVGWVRMIYGNGYDVISDYTTNLESALAEAISLADELEGQHA